MWGRFLTFVGNITFSDASQDIKKSEWQQKNSKSPHQDNCQSRLNRTAIFRKPDFQSWFDPGNWISNSENIPSNIQLSSESLPSPIPHLQRIPCRYDKVSFPSNAAYKVFRYFLHLGVLELNITRIYIYILIIVPFLFLRCR